MTWNTSPDLWGQISSLAHYVGGNPAHLLHLLEDLPVKSQDLYVTGTNLFKSLTCDKLELLSVRNDSLDAPKSQNMEPESNPGQNPLQTARPTGWEPNNPLLIDKIVTSLPGPKPLAVLQNSASKLPVQDAKNFPEVPTPETGDLLGEIRKFLHESYSKLPQSPREALNLKRHPIPKLTNRRIQSLLILKQPVANHQCQAPHFYLRPPMSTHPSP
ncbi:hypothetical protein DSO57_1022475 [Entomophthora muscae]|uniref:Uncharacterized protein n=1 Tax=Entomophthora muscae TaxID=34485 RepID=A0ACC2SSD5_9FUNG|nr:hypothetical protein DSO57_1022475 [Entomophthora muscae]